MDRKEPGFRAWKKTPEVNADRLAVAEQIRTAREMEKLFLSSYKRKDESMYETYRTGDQYIAYLGGLEHLFKYVRTLPSQKVLDIGAGKGKALPFLAKSRIGEGLIFEGTALLSSSKTDAKLYLTSAEVLRGVASNSYGAVLALISLSYVKTPEFAAEQIDRVLVPGGIIKFTFPLEDIHHKNRAGEVVNQAAGQKYAELFRKRGYDVATIGMDDTARLVVGIKPGGDGSSFTWAKKLMDRDLQTRLEQLENL